MRTIQVNLHSFDELSKEVQQQVVDKCRTINVDHDQWSEPILEGFKQYALQQGWDVDRIYFSGFWSQGDGAMFEGSLTDFSKYLSPRLQALVDKGYINMSYHVEHRGHYYHERCSDHYVSFDIDGVGDYPNIEGVLDEVADSIREDYYTLCQELYRDLENYYEELTNDEAIIDTILANDFEFTQEGVNC
jgi:hypothetical protein